MPPSNRKRRGSSKQKREAGSNASSVLAVRRPSPDPESEDAPADPYFAEQDLKEWIEDFSAGAAADDPDDIQETMASGANFLAGLAEELAAGNRQATETLTCLLGQQQQALYEGTYAKGEGNAVFAMEAFLFHHRAGLYPPDWVLDWLYSAFEKYLKSAGESDIGRLLGTKRGPGQSSVIEEHKRIVAEGDHMQEIASLTSLGIAIPDAAAMVHARLEASGRKCPSADVLAERFIKRGWSKAFQPMKPLFADLGHEDKKRIAAAYPEHTIPTKLR